MANELAVVKDNWLELVNDTTLPKPFQQEIFLQECHVAGTMHVEDILVKTAGIDTGSVLTLRRDPKNVHDELAISVVTADGEHVGWVPKKYNQPYARLMDAGKLLVAKVAHKEVEDDWLNMRIEIYMKDI